MGKMNKRITAVTATAVLAGGLLLQGCGGQKGEGPVKIELGFYHFEAMSPTKELYEGLVEDFQEKYPRISVNNMEYAESGASYNSKLLTMSAASTPPDVFEIITVDLMEFVKRGVVLNLDDYIEKSGQIDLDDWYAEIVDAFRFDGEVCGKGSLYGLPKDWSGLLNPYYNRKLFDEAGVPYPDESWSWEELLEASKKLTKRAGNGRALQFGGGIGRDLLRVSCLMYQNGGSVFTPDGKKCVLDSDESIEAYEFLIEDMVHEARCVPDISEAGTQSAEDMFMTGRLGMIFEGRYKSPVLEDKIKDFEWGVGPSLHRKKRANIVVPCGFSVSSRSPRPEEAFRFLEFIAGPVGAARNAKLGWNIPAIKSIAESELFLTNPGHPEGINRVFLEDAKYAISYPSSKYIAFSRLTNIVSRQVGLAYLGKKTVREALVKAAKEVNEVIAGNIEKEEKEKNKR